MPLFNFLIHRINVNIAKSLVCQKRVVDLGCGTAPYKAQILKTAEKYIGMDWPNSLHSPENVDIFASLNQALPLKNGCADGVVSFQVMEHLREPEFFLREAYRILKPGGKLFLTVPFQWHLHESPHDYFRYTKFGLEYLIKNAGFSEIKVKANTGFWTTWVLKFNYHTHRYTSICKPWSYLFGLPLVPIWVLGQLFALCLDGVDRHEEETASYTAEALKV